MLKRVKRKTSKQRCTAEKAEDANLNSNKNEVSSEVELLQQVTAELKAELKTLKEQLEREKKTSAEVKSLKTQQVCTLTFKLANAVRQREQAEEELAKMQQEMEELKERIKSQEKDIKARRSDDTEDVEYGRENKSVGQELLDVKETGDSEKTVPIKIKGDKFIGTEESKGLANDEVASESERCSNEASGGDKQIKINEELEKVLEMHEKEPKISESGAHENLAERLFSKEKAKEKEGDSSLLDELTIKGNSNMFTGRVEDEGDKNSPENSLQGEAHHCDGSQSDISLVSSLAVSEFESWKEKSSILEKSEESVHREDIQYSSSEICFSSRANSSFETCDESVEGKDDVMQDLNIPSNHLLLSERSSTIPNVKNSLRKSLTKPDDEDKMSQNENPRLAPLPFHNDESVGYLSDSADSLVHHEMVEDQSVKVYPGSYQKAQEGNPSSLVNKDEKDDVTTGGDFVTFNLKQQTATPKQGKQNYSSSHNMSEDVKDLREQLKSALKEIEVLRLENKEIKKKVQKLSTSAEENAFLVKTAKFTDRLLREMKEKEAKAHAQRRHSFRETYGSENDLSFLRKPELSSARWLTNTQRRSDECYDRSTQSKPSLSCLKALGAKLKEITRSFENLAIEPELRRESLRQPSRPSVFLDYDQSAPYLTPRNDDLGIAEQFIIPPRCSERLSTVQSVPTDLEASRETPAVVARTAVEKLGEEENIVPANTQYQLTEKRCVWRDQKFHITDHAPEMQGLEGCPGHCLHDTNDHIQRYIVRSSEYIAKLRDLKPEEMAFDSKLTGRSMIRDN